MPAPSSQRPGVGYRAVLGAPGALRFAVPGFVGRLPLSMLGLGSVVLVEQAYGGYALAGVVAAATALAQAATAPLLGRAVDRCGQAAVLGPALVGHVVGVLALLGAVAAGLAPEVLVVAALVAGGTLPPVAACVRSRWTAVLGRDLDRDPHDLQTAFALEAVVDELVFIVGPVLVTTLAVAVSPYVGLGASLLAAVAGTLAFVAARDTDPGPRPPADAAHPAALRAPGLRVLGGVFLCVGTLFGSVEVVMVAFAGERAVPAAAGLLLGCVAGGSLLSGLAYGGRRWRSALDVRFRVGLLVLALGVAPLPGVAALGLGPPAMVPVALLAGLAIAPTVVGGYALTERLVAPAALTEGFTWLTTALGLGVAIGAGVSGALVDAGGSAVGFLVPLLGGALAAVLAVAGGRALAAARPAAAGGGAPSAPSSLPP